MFEALLGSLKGPPPLFPDSGPGTKYLKAGNATAGYFGEVTAAELFDGWELVSFGNITTGSQVKVLGLTWLKFIFQNRIVYIAKQQVLANISWTDIYNAGFVYGERGNGKYPVGAGADQLKIKLKNEGGRDWYLKVRLPSGAAEDPAISTTGSEWNALMHNVSKDYNSGIRWAQFTTAELSAVSDLASHVKESGNGLTTSAHVRGSGANVSTISLLSKGFTSHWRPVLELVDASGYAFEPQQVEYVAGGLIPPSVTVQPIDPSTLLYGPKDIVVAPESLQAPGLNGYSFTDAVVSPVDVISDASTMTDFAFSIADADMVSDPQNPYWAGSTMTDFAVTFTTI